MTKKFLLYKLYLTFMRALQNLWKLLVLILTLQASVALAALDRFEVVLWQNSAEVWQSLDITITAVDRNWETVTDYDGSILVFSESDASADFPNDLSENSYTFEVSDEWEVKFENAVKFSAEWVQDIHVYDLNDENILWVVEVDISEKEVVADLDISIYTPEPWLTIGKNSVTVSWGTSKNYRVKIILNGDKEITTTSNNDGIFEKEIEGLAEWENKIQAFVLDADDNEVGSTKEIMIKVNSNAPELKQIKITPTWEMDAETKIDIEVYSSAGLSSSEIILNDIITPLEEWQDGLYTGSISAPTEAWFYYIDVILKDDFGHETRKLKAESITVRESVDLNAATSEVKNTISEPSGDLNAANLDITDLKLTMLKTKSVLSWNAVKAASSYNVYKKMADGELELIDNTVEPRYEIAVVWDEVSYDFFAVKAMTNTGNGETVEWDLSEMTKVQTGPTELILLLLAMILWLGVVMFTKSKRA